MAIRRIGFLLALAIMVGALFAMAAPAAAQTPPKATATPTAAVKPPVAPLPAKTGNAGLHAQDAPIVADAAAAIGMGTVLATLAGTIALAVALVKMAIPANVPSRALLGIVGVVAVAVLWLAYASKMLPPGTTPFDLFSTWLTLAAGAIGLREGVSTATGGASERLPTVGG